MEIKKTSRGVTVDILGMTQKEFVALKAMINMSRVESNEKMKGCKSIWRHHMKLEEAQELAMKVGNIIWGLTVEGEYQSSTGSAKSE